MLPTYPSDLAMYLGAVDWFFIALLLWIVGRVREHDARFKRTSKA